MSYSYEQQKKKGSKKSSAETFVSGEKESFLPNSAMVENLGHQVDMPVVMREKMEGAFGMDLSDVKLYENKAVGKAGAEAVAQGSNIAFAPGKMDFTSTHGQALLGHEISHVASQARGEVKGSGLVNDHALEARADREGLMAARGESVTPGYGGASAPLSNASAASAAGPMQAKSGKRNQEIIEEEPENESRWKNKDGSMRLISDEQDYQLNKKRGWLGTIYDWFSTVSSHWFNPSDDLKKLRQERAAAEMGGYRPRFINGKSVFKHGKTDKILNTIDDGVIPVTKNIPRMYDDEPLMRNDSVSEDEEIFESPEQIEAKRARLSKFKKKWKATDYDIDEYLGVEEYGGYDEKGNRINKDNRDNNLIDEEIDNSDNDLIDEEIDEENDNSLIDIKNENDNIKENLINEKSDNSIANITNENNIINNITSNKDSDNTLIESTPQHNVTDDGWDEDIINQVIEMSKNDQVDPFKEKAKQLDAKVMKKLAAVKEQNKKDNNHEIIDLGELEDEVLEEENLLKKDEGY